jgi:hypothetical protein
MRNPFYHILILLEFLFRDFDASCFRAGADGLGHQENPDFPYIYGTELFSLEVLFHQRLLNSHIRTFNTAEADLFLFPYYAGLDYYCIGEPPTFQAPAIAEHAQTFWNYASRQPLLANGSRASAHFLFSRVSSAISGS